ncbi:MULTISPECIES: hypothetical protein [unclassified Leptolyngbya]|uniref:hypothetical protein n=1 Tax=unclassified Leptolyngbya TaxID=2650499 RepID=UPI001683829E|nr:MULTISPECIES: hypothetical protein [unclassified Leptolyngbya]MBD1913756.1 hypothetical protein [Leptolyngbya sp. FACHB-8]MBD2153208.1 hypothetical protein [Leptolyngbya sp. FACHB-16]
MYREHADFLITMYLNQIPSALAGSASPDLWTQLLTTLVVGLLTALGFQLLLTNLGLVLGLSAFGMRFFKNKERAEPLEAEESASGSGAIATTLGFGFLFTVNIVLFTACFLGTRFSQVAEPMMGAIAGLTIWSAYVLLLTWLSTRTLNSVAGFIVDRATGGVRWAGGAIASLFRNDASDSLTEEETAELIREGIQSALNRAGVQQLLEAQLQPFIAASRVEAIAPANAEDQLARAAFWQPIKIYLTETDSKSLTPKRIQRKLETLFRAAEEKLPENQALPHFEPEILRLWLEQREDINAKKQRKIMTEVEQSWSNFEAHYASQLLSNSVESLDVEPQDTSSSLQEKLQSVLEQTIDNTLSNLDLAELLHRSKVPVTYGIGIALLTLAEALPRLAKSELLPETMRLDMAEIKPSLDYLLKETQANLTNLGQSSLEQMENMRDRTLQPLEKLQNRIQAQVDSLKRQAYEQAESAQRSAIKALWWLFAIASTGAISSAAAGVLATKTFF